MYKATGLVIKKLRTDNNLTQQQLGYILGVKKSAIQKYENGSVPISIESLKKLCIHFQITPWIFVFANDLIEYINEQESLHDIESAFFTHWLVDAGYLFTRYSRLTPEARLKVENYVNDLLKIPEYILVRTKDFIE